MLHQLLTYLENNYYLIWENHAYTVKHVTVKSTRKFRVQFYFKPDSPIQYIEYLDGPLTFFYILYKLPHSKKMIRKSVIRTRYPELLI